MRFLNSWKCRPWSQREPRGNTNGGHPLFGVSFSNGDSTYCLGHVNSIHVHASHIGLKHRFGTFRVLQYQYHEVGKWKGGITVSDPIGKKSAAALFVKVVRRFDRDQCSRHSETQADALPKKESRHASHTDSDRSVRRSLRQLAIQRLWPQPAQSPSTMKMKHARVVALLIVALSSQVAAAVSPNVEEMDASRQWVAARFVGGLETNALDPLLLLQLRRKAFSGILEDVGVETGKPQTGRQSNAVHADLRRSQNRVGRALRRNRIPRLPVCRMDLVLQEYRRQGHADLVRHPGARHSGRTQARGRRRKGRVSASSQRRAAGACRATTDRVKRCWVPEQKRSWREQGGRPTTNHLSCFNLELSPDEGLIFAVGWPGQLATRLNRDKANGLRIRVGAGIDALQIVAGRRGSHPAVALQFWRGDDWLAPRTSGAGGLSPTISPARRKTAADPMDRRGADGQGIMDQSTAALPSNTSPAIWNAASSPMFGGWMPAGIRAAALGRTPALGKSTNRAFPRDFAPSPIFCTKTGSTRSCGSSPNGSGQTPGSLSTIPNGFSAAKAALWSTSATPMPGSGSSIAWMHYWLSEGVDVYRQDFNMEPLSYWRANDAKDRQGITEIRHVTGLLAYWDELLRRHPNMLYDNCASGGQRNDLESMRRGVAYYKSDYALSQSACRGRPTAFRCGFPIMRRLGCGTTTPTFAAATWPM